MAWLRRSSLPGLTALRRRIDEFDAAEVREIDVSELNHEESRKLAGALLPAEVQQRATQVAKESQGSPFFITELARFAASGHEQAAQLSLEGAIKARLSALSDSERQVLEAICVSARPMQQSLLRAVVNDNDVAVPLRSLQANSLIRHTAGPRGRVTSYHDRIRESVVAAMDAPYLQKWHTKIAECDLEACPTARISVVLAEHLLGAGERLAGRHLRSQCRQACTNNSRVRGCGRDFFKWRWNSIPATATINATFKHGWANHSQT